MRIEEIDLAGLEQQHHNLSLRKTAHAGQARDEPDATADVRGSGMSRESSSWDPASGRYGATFVIDRTDGPIVFTVVAKDRAGNEARGTAITQVAGTPPASTSASPTATPAPTPGPSASLSPTASPAPTAAATPGPTPTASPVPTAGPNTTPPTVSVTAPASVAAVTGQEVTITAQISDSGGGLRDPPDARADVNGSGMSPRTSSWDATTGRYSATFVIDRVDGPIVFTVTAEDRAGNEGRGTATTLVFP